MADDSLPRRRFLVGAGTAMAAGLAPAMPAQAQNAGKRARACKCSGRRDGILSRADRAVEAAFFSAVADTMIPADELTPSGSDCAVVKFIDGRG